MWGILLRNDLNMDVSINRKKGAFRRGPDEVWTRSGRGPRVANPTWFPFMCKIQTEKGLAQK